MPVLSLDNPGGGRSVDVGTIVIMGADNRDAQPVWVFLPNGMGGEIYAEWGAECGMPR